MQYQCIKCKFIWGEKDNDYDLISHGLCRSCFVKIMKKKIHKKQLDEGNFDCFGKSTGYCDQSNCKYRDYCIVKGDDYVQ